MEDLQRRVLNQQVLLRLALLVAALILGLVLANAAASLFQVWRLDPGAAVPDPWSGLFGEERVTQQVLRLSLLGAALLAGASLSLLVFLVDRVVREVWTWLRDLVRR